MQDNKEKATIGAKSDMNYGISYGYSVISLPGAALDFFPKAKKSDIYVLVAYLSDPTVSVEELAEKCSTSEATVDEALYFWMEAGIIVPPPKPTTLPEADSEELDEAESVDTTETAESAEVEASAEAAEEAEKADATEESAPKGKKSRKGRAVSKSEAKAKAGDPSTVTMSELSESVEGNQGVTDMIDNCERICGRIFNTNEVSKIVALKEYLGVTSKYIELVATYCVDIGKSSTRSIESSAAKFFDQGIRDEEALDKYMIRHYKLTEIEGRLRALFGINMTRSLTKKEQRILETWVKTYCYGYDEIKIAYEITVDAIQEPSLNYTNAILEKWHSRGLADAEMIRKALAEEAEEKPRDSQSFDSDDFFEAALSRSYRNSGTTPELPPETTPKKTTRRTKK